MGIIEARDLVHEYIIRDEEGNVESIRTALDHMDLSVEVGQFIAVLGHNGSGKSTFAKHLNALLTPSEGTLIVDGMDVSDESLTYDIRQEAGMVFQNRTIRCVCQCGTGRCRFWTGKYRCADRGDLGAGWKRA